MKSTQESSGPSALDAVTINQRVRAIKHSLSPRRPKAHLGAELDQTYCPRIPAHFAIWFVVAMCLFTTDTYRQVFRLLAELGTHVIWKTKIGTYLQGEMTLVKHLFQHP